MNFRRTIAASILLMASNLCLMAADRDLTAYFIAVEGGQATLFITPSGQTVLIDTGFPGFEGRDAGRIAAAAKDAGVKQIDYLIITHFHLDHAGGVPALNAAIPVRNFADHGEMVERTPCGRKAVYRLPAGYGQGHRIVVKPGDRLPIPDLRWTIVSAAGKVVDLAVPSGGQPNTFCAGVAPQAATSRAKMPNRKGSVITYGKFRMVDLGDLTWNKERDLMCPVNKVGPVDGVRRQSPRTGHQQLAAAGSCPPSESGNHGQRREQGRTGGGVGCCSLQSGDRGYLAVALLRGRR